MAADSDSFFFYRNAEETRIKVSQIQNEDGTITEERTPYTHVYYTVVYVGDDYITEDVFGLTEDQKALAADFADSLSFYLDVEEDDGTAN